MKQPCFVLLSAVDNMEKAGTLMQVMQLMQAPGLLSRKQRISTRTGCVAHGWQLICTGRQGTTHAQTQTPI